MSKNQLFNVRVALAFVALAAIVTLTSSIAPAQETAPRADIFGGYSWLHPGGSVAITGPPGPTLGTAAAFNLGDYMRGFDFAAAWNFDKWVALEGDVGRHYCGDVSIKSGFPPSNAIPTTSGVCLSPDIGTLMAGPRLTLRSTHLSPFVHLLVGGARMEPKQATLYGTTGFSGAFGGGMDLWILRNRIALRLFQADLMYEAQRVAKIGGDGTFVGARVQGGLVLGLGSIKPPVAPTATCSLQPTEVMAGEPVTATMSTQNFNPKHTIEYTWESTGGKVAPKDQTATVDTTGLAPGKFTVSGSATDPKANKKFNTAKCDGQQFTVKEPPKHPPTASCSANPATVKSGDSSTITAQGNSPDNRPLTYDWKASGGHVAGTGATATLDTAGAAAGAITVTTTVTDDRGLSAEATCTVQVEVPPPAPQASKIGEISFPNTKKPGRVDNTAKAILDDVALRLQREPDAKAVIVGDFDPDEKGGVKLAEERAVNTKAYLTEEKGIDKNRIEVRTGTAGGRRAEIYLVPAGATFAVEGTQTFDENAMKQPAKKAPVHKHAMAKKPAA
jgi:outer membrane protein OmpA-like peptidoglycan-associated protein